MQSFNFHTPRKTAHFYVLLSLAKEDGHVSPEETAFLKRYGGLAGIGETEVEELIQNHRGADLMHLKINNQAEKEKFISDLMVLALADGKLHLDEKRKIYQIAETINMSEAVVDKLFNLIQTDSGKIKKLLESFSQPATEV